MTSFVLSVDPSFTKIIPNLSLGYSSARSDCTVPATVVSSFQQGTIMATLGYVVLETLSLLDFAGKDKNVTSMKISKYSPKKIKG